MIINPLKSLQQLPEDEVIPDKKNQDLNNFVVIGGKSVLSSAVSIEKGMKIAAHSVIQRGAKVQEDVLLD